MAKTLLKKFVDFWKNKGKIKKEAVKLNYVRSLKL